MELGLSLWVSHKFCASSGCFQMAGVMKNRRARSPSEQILREKQPLDTGEQELLVSRLEQKQVCFTMYKSPTYDTESCLFKVLIESSTYGMSKLPIHLIPRDDQALLLTFVACNSIMCVPACPMRMNREDAFIFPVSHHFLKVNHHAFYPESFGTMSSWYVLKLQGLLDINPEVAD